MPDDPHTTDASGRAAAAGRVSLDDVAKICGVSASTVSRVLNDQPGVSAKTRQAVLSAVKELSYVPSAAGQTLSTSKTRSIGVLTYRRVYPRSLVTSADISAGIVEEAGLLGYHVLTGIIGEETVKGGEQIPMVREKRIDGIIAIGPVLTASFLMRLHQAGKPIITVDTALRNTDVDCVMYENEEPVYEIVSHLLENGHTNVVFLSGPKEWPSSDERARGYSRAMRERSLEPRVVHMADTTVETGERAMQWLISTGELPTAVVSVNDATAIGVCRACKAGGIRVPEDIAISGFDDIEWAQLHDPPLTTVRTYPDEMGRQAVRRLIEVIEAPGDHRHVRVRLRVAAEVVYRRSSGD